MEENSKADMFEDNKRRMLLLVYGPSTATYLVSEIATLATTDTSFPGTQTSALAKLLQERVVGQVKS